MVFTYWHTGPLCYSIILSSSGFLSFFLSLFIWLDGWLVNQVGQLPSSFVFIFMDLHKQCDRTFSTSRNLENYKYLDVQNVIYGAEGPRV